MSYWLLYLGMVCTFGVCVVARVDMSVCIADGIAYLYERHGYFITGHGDVADVAMYMCTRGSA